MAREALEYIPTLKAMGQRNPDENITFAGLYERFYASHADRVKDYSRRLQGRLRPFQRYFQYAFYLRRR